MDIRKLLDALSSEDKAVWQHCRTNMRKAYISAHNTIHGVEHWELEDDAFLDLIDIKIATLFDRNGRLENAEEVIPSADNIEDEIRKAVRSVDSKVDNHKSAELPNSEDSQKSASPDELRAIGEAVSQLTDADKQAAVPNADPTRWGNIKAVEGSSSNGLPSNG